LNPAALEVEAAGRLLTNARGITQTAPGDHLNPAAPELLPVAILADAKRNNYICTVAPFIGVNNAIFCPGFPPDSGAIFCYHANITPIIKNEKRQRAEIQPFAFLGM